MVKLDVELVRFGIFIDGEDLHKTPNINGQQSDAIENQLIDLLQVAKTITYDFPQDVYADILDNTFTQRMKLYH
jgi:hypothetical protein